ncbi:uncharacterized protein CDAR_432211 [Caerostris darwini]|uniref:Uncharacterized protein n=1 Tax=Caerostris darwini TaxID=1538125 RepID=A0AAV4U302_9ARAC|nr:uncharacterized protein CDAR_432211 [Caerostris darwini]
MANWWIVLTACVVVVAGRKSHEDDVGEYGKYNEWRKQICEKNSEDMLAEMDSCFLLETKMIQDAAKDCISEIAPETQVFTKDFVMAACENKDMYKKLDECFAEYEANVEFKKQMELRPEIVSCYSEILKKYELEALMHYLDETSEK